MNYFGDDYLKFTDFLNTLTIPEIVEVQFNMNIPLVSLGEQNFYLNLYSHIINRIKCVRELKKEKNKDKKIKILEKYNLKPQDVQNPDYLR